MKVKVTQPAGPNQRFAPDAWEGQIGKVVQFDGEDATLVDAVVSEDGHEVTLTFEVPESGQVASKVARP